MKVINNLKKRLPFKFINKYVIICINCTNLLLGFLGLLTLANMKTVNTLSCSIRHNFVSEFWGSKVNRIFKLSMCLECPRDLSQCWINLSLIFSLKLISCKIYLGTIRMISRRSNYHLHFGHKADNLIFHFEEPRIETNSFTESSVEAFCSVYFPKKSLHIPK